MSGPRLVTPPTTVPVSLDEAKAHLRVDHTDEDDLIEALVAAATALFDGYQGILGRALEEQTWEHSLEDFPARVISLPLGPAVSVTEVAYDDPDGVEQTVDPANYIDDVTEFEGRIVPRWSYTWPRTECLPGSVRVTFVAGSGCPLPVKHAILLTVGSLYADREAGGIPAAAMALAGPYRRVRL